MKKTLILAAVISLTAFYSCSSDDDTPREVTVEHSSRGAFATSTAISVIGGDTRTNFYELITYGIYGSSLSIYAPYFSFDLSEESGTVTNAVLRIYTGSYNSTADSETIQFNEVITSAEDLATTPESNEILDAINADLADGTVYGSFDITAADDNTFIEVELNEDAITAINTMLGSGTWSVGGSLITASTEDHVIDEVFNFNDAPTPDATELILTIE